MHPSGRLTLRKLVLIIDGVIVLAAMFLAYGLHLALRPHVPLLKTPPSLDRYLMLAYFALPLWIALIWALGLHRIFERHWTRTALLLDLIKLHALGLLAVSTVLFSTKTDLNRSLVGLFVGCTFALLYTERGLLGLWLRYQFRIGQGRHRLLLVGWPERVMSWFAEVAVSDLRAPALVGYLSPGDDRDGCGARDPTDRCVPPAVRRYRGPRASQAVPRHLGTLDNLGEVLHDEAVDQVLFFPPLNDPVAATSALEICQQHGVPAAFAINMEQGDQATPRVVSLYDYPFIAFEVAPKKPEALALKHAMDIFGALVALLLVAPVIFVAGLSVLLTMGRPIFFSQERVGLFGRRFKMFKFRTMIRDAEAQKEAITGVNEMDGPVFKAAQDPRITRLGRWLRRSSIDELPQLINVLRGEMSLVGPRPLPVSEQQQIRGLQRRRLTMKPGITGLWQVSGRSNLGFDEWMKLDLQYVERWSLALDLRLILVTIPYVLIGKGAR